MQQISESKSNSSTAFGRPHISNLNLLAAYVCFVHSTMFRHSVTFWTAAILCSIALKTGAIHEPLRLRRGPMDSKDPGNHRELQTVDWTEWYVGFDSAEAKFIGTNDPNVVLKYTGPAPLSTVKYYKLQIMDPTCSQFVLNGAVKPHDLNGLLPASAYNAATSEVTALVDINTATIKSSTTFYTAGAAPELFTVSFCARMELYNDDDMALASESTTVTFSVDTTQTFEMGNIQFTGEVVSTADEVLMVEFPLNRVSCDDNNNVAAVTNIFPGQPIQVCISSKSTQARVVNLRSVYIENSVDVGLKIPLVNANSGVANAQTTLNCAQGVCNLKTIAFARLFEWPHPDGSVTDISSTSKITGTAMLALTSRRRNLNEEESGGTAVSGFDWHLDLAHPPPPSAAPPPLITVTVAILGCVCILLQW